jgi:hypothetical protein
MSDMGCACVCSVVDYGPDIYRSKTVNARKQHTCCECGEKIRPGEEYEYASGLWEGSWEHYKTCGPCVLIRSDVCCHSWIFGELRSTIWEELGFDYVTEP